MPQCAFKNCVNNHRNSKVSEGVSFFRFPSDPFRCAEWISIVAEERGEEHYKPLKNSTICSIHFDKFKISGNNQRRRLLKTATPKPKKHIGEKNIQKTLLTELTTVNSEKHQIKEEKEDQTTDWEDDDEIPIDILVKEETQITEPKPSYYTIKRRVTGEPVRIAVDGDLEPVKVQDECANFGDYVSVSLRKHDEKTQSIIKQAINNILTEHEMKKLNNA